MDLWAPAPIPKKRTSRACDVCRRKKIRCDGAEKPDNRCSGCVSHNVECTYESHSTRASGSNHHGSLEERLLEMESKLNRFPQATDQYPQSLSAIYPNTKRVATSTNEELEQYGIPELSQDMEDLTLPHQSFFKHYHGRSSTFSYYMMAKLLNRGPDPNSPDAKQVSSALQWKHRRQRFWEDREKKMPLPKKIIRPSDASFPHEELGKRLLATFFGSNHVFPYMLDRVEVERKYHHGEHHRDDIFAALLFMIFAFASKFITDEPAVLKTEGDPYSAGDAYADIVQPYYRMFQGPVSLEELQGMVLFVFHQFASGRSHPAWVVIGVTVRLALDVGAHRRRPEAPTKEAEYWKRTFWCAFISDVHISCMLGQITACGWHDIDLEFPVALPGDNRPVDFICCALKLMRIQDGIMRALYSVKRPVILDRVLGEDYDQTVVAQLGIRIEPWFPTFHPFDDNYLGLDSDLNEWFEAVPEHLKWNPENKNLADLEQSAQLYSVAYNASQLIHRPFIPTPDKKPISSIPSLAICTRAARSCANVLNVARKHRMLLMPGSIHAGFASAITLLIASWSALSAGSKLDYNAHLLDVDKCVRYMMMVENFYVVAGRLVDITRELAGFGGMELADTIDSPPNLKRNRDEEGDMGDARPGPHPSPKSAQSNPIVTALFSPPPNLGNVYPTPPSGPIVPGSLPFDTSAIGVPPTTDPNALWGTAPMAAFMPADATQASQPLMDASQPLMAGSFPEMSGTDPIFGDPSLWPSQGPSYLPPLQAAEAATLTHEALGLWSFAPPTFEWERWGTMIDTIKYDSAGEPGGAT